VFCVNKSDLGAPALRTASELETALSLVERERGGWRPPVLLISARDGLGIDALLDALAAHREHALAGGDLAVQRREGAIQHVLATLTHRYGDFGLERIGGLEAVRQRMEQPPERSPYRWGEVLATEVEDALRKGQ
jgi:LAO/AO transport system kinase